ncbi:MAG: methionyl-tRNA formyltransferase [Chloroflexia bacterium]|nr:methionyl-tRNA formyltransferase [Chloroflexia bacterium]
MSHRIVFLGSPEFAVPSLQALTADTRFDVVMVVSQPNRPSGRGRRLAPPPVAAFAVDAGLPLLQPESLRDEDVLSMLQVTQADLLVVVAYGEILRRNLLELAPGGVLNVHPSLLPKYRGAAPIAGAIRNGDSQTGVSIIQLVRKLDAGPMIAQTTVDIDSGDTTGTLGERLSEQAADILPDVCVSWLAGSLTAVEQDDSLATYTREWTKADAEIDWLLPAVTIERLVRAALPWPVAWTSFDGQRLQVRSASVTPGAGASPGQIVDHGKQLVVATGSGYLELLTVQPQGRTQMPASGWWNGLQSKPSRLGIPPTTDMPHDPV